MENKGNVRNDGEIWTKGDKEKAREGRRKENSWRGEGIVSYSKLNSRSHISQFVAVYPLFRILFIKFGKKFICAGAPGVEACWAVSLFGEMSSQSGERARRAIAGCVERSV